MPLYEYVCPECQQLFEKRVAIAEADQAACPRCGSQHTKRQLSRIALQFQNMDVIPLASSGHTCGSPSCCGGMCATDYAN
jgi:putative FmdB family regulatory protein